MKTFGRVAIAVVAMVCLWNVTTAAARESVKFSEEIYRQFDNEEIKPYIKIMKGVWVPSTIDGILGDYKITALMPPGANYIIGLFDHKVGRAGIEERSAVVLIDGVNPLNPKESVDVEELDSTDVSQFRKYALDGLTYNATDNAGKDCCMIVVDNKEEYEWGPVKPFVIPSNRTGKSLGRVHILIFAGPAMPPNPGQVVEYGKPIAKFTFMLQNDGKKEKKEKAAAVEKAPVKGDDSVRVGKPVQQ